ncbi:hypothetical protein FOA43_001831 [Brettanomyces nanus]|uniref:2-dehydropantolactone reductase n=1 Tax=Eeniella nana TaxID=13502 RepID=A0A875RYB3_EENNA|nr:uncharacterized protein FOA43_001831 [Brettanomyces nanus]QPG74501.1 hypothetical protein FOA43_001831 [Brettanomyces nanus]
MDAFAYCSKYGKENYDEYRRRYRLKTDDENGSLKDRYDVEFERKQAKDVIHVITATLKSKGLETPFLILPFRPSQSDQALKDFLNLIFKQGGELLDADHIETVAEQQNEATAMPPGGQTNRLPKQLQQILKNNVYPPSPTSTVASSQYMQEIPKVTLRVNHPSRNPAELLSRVSRTLKFDNPTLFYTREDFLLLKRLFKNQDAIMDKLSPEGCRIMDNVCLYDEDLVSDGSSRGNHIRFKLAAGWSHDMTSQLSTKKSHAPDFFTADVSRASIDDYFIWAWMASLGNEETSIKKKTFGKTYIMEAQLAEGFKKWVIVEEQDFERDKYDLELEIKQEKLKTLETKIQSAQKRATTLMIKSSPARNDLYDITNHTDSQKVLPPPPPKKDYDKAPLPLEKDYNMSRNVSRGSRKAPPQDSAEVESARQYGETVQMEIPVEGKGPIRAEIPVGGNSEGMYIPYGGVNYVARLAHEQPIQIDYREKSQSPKRYSRSPLGQQLVEPVSRGISPVRDDKSAAPSRTSNVRHPCLNSGNSIPILGFGVFQIPENDTSSLVEKALEVGYRHFDSAMDYENEAGTCDGIAKWIAQDPINNKREDVFYTTKIFDHNQGYEKTKQAIKDCLAKAKPIGYIDMILIHSPRTNYEKRHGSWIALQEAVEEKGVRNIGVSNYGIKHLEELLGYPDLKIVPAVNQVELSPWLMRQELVDYCKEKGINVEAFSPLTRGFHLGDKDLNKVASKHGKSAAQILIKWSMTKGLIPLPKTVNESRLAANFDVFDFQLTDDDLKLIEHKGAYGIISERWDPSTYPLDSEK